MNELQNCGCCEGVTIRTPGAIVNRPGLDALRYRIGTHGDFFQSLLARINTFGAGDPPAFPDPLVPRRLRNRPNNNRGSTPPAEYLLRKLLTTRDASDAGIALLDCWATLADVLTFYQERIANEGFLRTAQEIRSIDELARLVGYQLRPGVSSSVYLAFEVTDPAVSAAAAQTPPKAGAPASSAEILIPSGTAVKSTPAPGADDQPQTFETSFDLTARPEWNALLPRQTLPPRLDSASLLDLNRLTFAGIGLRLRPNDWLVIDADPQTRPAIRQILSTHDDPQQGKTEVQFARGKLSARQLFDDVDRRFNAFLTSFLEANRLINQDFVDAKRLTIRQALDAALLHIDTNRLEGTDGVARALLCSQLLGPRQPASPATNTPLGVAVDAVKNWAAKAKALLAMDGGVLGTSQFIHVLTSAYDDLKAQQTDHVTRAQKLLSDVSSLNVAPGEDPVSKANSLILSALRNDTLVRTQLPKGPSPPLPVDLCPQRTFSIGPDGRIAPSLIVSGAGATDFSGTVSASFLVPKAMDKLLVGSADIESNAQDQIRRLRCSLGAELGPRWILLTLHDKRADRTSALALQELSNGDFSNEFPLLQNQKFVLCTAKPPATLFLDPRFTLTAGADGQAVYSAKLTAVPTGSVTLTFLENDTFQPGRDGESLTINLKKEKNTCSPAELQTALRHVTFLPPTSHAWVTVVILRAGDAVAAALREIVPAASDAPLLAVADEVSELYGNLNSPAFANLSDSATASRAKLTRLERAIDALPKLEPSLSSPLAESLSSAQTSFDRWSEAFSSNDIKELRDECKAFLTARVDNVLGPSLKCLYARAADAFHRQIEQYENEASPFSHGIESFRQGLQPTSGQVLLDDVQKFASMIEGVRASLQQLASTQENGADHLSVLIKNAAADIAGEIVERQKLVASGLDAIRRAPSPQPDGDIVQRLNEIQNSLKAPDSANGKAICDPNETLSRKLGMVLTESGSGRVGDQSLHDGGKTLAELAKGLSSEAAKPIQSMIDQWRTFIRPLLRVDPPAPTLRERGGNLTTPGGVVLAVRQAVDGPTGTASSLDEILAAIGEDSDLVSQVAAALDNRLRPAFVQAMKSFRQTTGLTPPHVYVLRSMARVFGWNAPDVVQRMPVQDFLTVVADNVPCLADHSKPDWTKFSHNIETVVAQRGDVLVGHAPTIHDAGDAEAEGSKVVFLDGAFERTRQNTVIAIRMWTPADNNNPLPDGEPVVYRVRQADTRPRSAYGLRGETTRIALDNCWWPDCTDQAPEPPVAFAKFRNARVYCDADELELAEDTIGGIVLSRKFGDGGGDIILDSVVFGLEAGRKLIVEGVRDLGANGEASAANRELLEVLEARHELDKDVYNGRYVTRLKFRAAPKFAYRRATARLYANVVQATHGETQREALGNGDAGKAFQEFRLKRPDLSRLPAPTPEGYESALRVTVNDVRWAAQNGFVEAKPNEHVYVTQTDSVGQTAVEFGDGAQGSRLPTGVGNVQAVYRSGLGAKGNVAAGRINQVTGAPLGVKGVKNPLPASGGADADTIAQARAHVPLAVMAMDRLVSSEDYGDFARNYAGIGKADATLLNGIVHVTIAGLDPMVIDSVNPLWQSLAGAFQRFGDPSQRFELHPREAALLIVEAKVRIAPDRQWDKLKLAIRDALFGQFSYERAELGKDLLLSDAIAAVQAVDGVVYVDMEKFDSVNESQVNFLAARLQCVRKRPRIRVAPSRFTTDTEELAALGLVSDDCDKMQAKDASGTSPDVPLIRGAQLCYLSEEVPDTLLLEQVQ